LVLGLLVVAMLVIGLYPQVILGTMQPSIAALVQSLTQGATQP
jgi:NADH:ubiquinone oxidoreductase subunit 4 (subunit M)